MVDPRVLEQKVYFSREQYEYLNKMFPEIVGSDKTTNEELRMWHGSRKVVKFVQSLVRGG